MMKAPTTTLTSNGNPRNPNRKKHSRFEFLLWPFQWIIKIIQKHKPKTIGQWVDLISAILCIGFLFVLMASTIEISNHADPWSIHYQQPYSWWNILAKAR